MRVKAVIFDLDGTLAIFNLDYKSLRAEVRGYLMHMGIPGSVLSVKESIFEMLKKTELYLKNSGKIYAIEEIRREALALAEKYEFEAAANTSLLSGATEILRALKQRGLKIGLCTINSEKSMNYILNRFGVAEYFDGAVPRDKVKNVKPHAEHLEAVLKILGTEAKDTIVVGDSGSDMLCAKEVKAIAVGLPTGVSTVKQLTGSGADYVMTSITDLPVLIDEIEKAQSPSNNH